MKVGGMAALLVTVLALAFEEGCGDGYMCTIGPSDKQGYAYGCAPISNMSHMVCCSTGQPDVSKWCNNTDPDLLPFCPGGGMPEGEGCVRMVAAAEDAGLPGKAH